MKMILSLMVLVFPLTAAIAGPGDTLWTRTYGGIYEEKAFSVQQTADEGFIIALKPFGLMKTDGNGDTLWTRSFYGNGVAVAHSARQTIDGGYVIAGSISSFSMFKFYMVKLNNNGDTLWTRTYGDQSYDGALSVQQTADGGYVLAGSILSNTRGLDFFLVKTDNNGDTLWTGMYGGVGDDKAYSVRQTADGGYIIAGFTDSFGSGDDDFCLIKTDSNGDALWTRTYGGTGDDEAYSAQIIADGYIIAGCTKSSGISDHNFFLVKTDYAGDTIWTRTYGGTRDDIAYSVQQSSDGGYIVAGSSNVRSHGYDAYIVKTDYNGDTVWTHNYGGYFDEVAYSVQQTADGAYIFVGFSTSFPPDNREDIYIVKIEGEATGVSDDDMSGAEMKISTNLHQYPNPFNSVTTISYDLPAACDVSLKIYNLAGQLVEILVDGPMGAGHHIVDWDASLAGQAVYSSGIYFYKLTIGKEIFTKRMTLLK